MNLVLFLSFFLSDFAYGAQSENEAIDWKYRSGTYLIFDCERLHYACVDRDGENNCRQERNFARGQKKTNLTCAPLGKYEQISQCITEQYKLQESNSSKKFCYPY